MANYRTAKKSTVKAVAIGLVTVLIAGVGMTDGDFANILHPNEAGSVKISNYMQSKLIAKWKY